MIWTALVFSLSAVDLAGCKFTGIFSEKGIFALDLNHVLTIL
jgi:hypothetical protein